MEIFSLIPIQEKGSERMNQLHKFLKAFIFVQLGSCFGRVLIKYLDFVMNPEVYAYYSAPWYTDIVVTLILTAITVLITTITYFIVGHLIKKHDQKESC